MDWDSSEECLFWAEPALTRQHFFQFLDDCPRGLLETENFGKLFFNFFRKSRASIGIRCFGTKNLRRKSFADVIRAPWITTISLLRVRIWWQPHVQ